MYDPISQDPPHDSDFPARMSEFEFRHYDALLNGVVFHPVGEGNHPLILLLHGLPGHERNLDLAHILRRAGWAVCVFHYRGAWGSSGAYRFAHVVEDVIAVAHHFREDAIAEKYRIDKERIITIGHSLGGWASLMASARGAVDTAVSISGANVGLWGQQVKEYPEFARPMLSSLIQSPGPLNNVTADDIEEELNLYTDDWDLFQQVDELKDKNLLIIGAKRDTITPVFDHHMPLINGLKEAGASNLTAKMIASDHSYSGNRIELALTLLDWLA